MLSEENSLLRALPCLLLACLLHVHVQDNTIKWTPVPIPQPVQVKMRPAGDAEGAVAAGADAEAGDEDGIPVGVEQVWAVLCVIEPVTCLWAYIEIEVGVCRPP